MLSPRFAELCHASLCCTATVWLVLLCVLYCCDQLRAPPLAATAHCLLARLPLACLPLAWLTCLPPSLLFGPLSLPAGKGVHVVAVNANLC